MKENNEEQESYDFECVDCEHLFTVDDAIVVGENDTICCPICGSSSLLDLVDEDSDF